MLSALGFDIDGTNLRVARVAAEGRIAERRSESITREPDAVVARLIAVCRELDNPTVDAIGIGVPGRVDPRRREALWGGYVDLAGHDLALRVETGLEKAVAVVAAALTQPWSNGQTTRLNLIKRQMFGRGKLDLLENRMIGAPQA